MMKRFLNLLLPVVFALNRILAFAAESNFHDPLGHYTTSWVGNSYHGDGGPNGFGYWVQNGADEIEVTPDGTVFAGTDWDEAGRCSCSWAEAP